MLIAAMRTEMFREFKKEEVMELEAVRQGEGEGTGLRRSTRTCCTKLWTRNRL